MSTDALRKQTRADVHHIIKGLYSDTAVGEKDAFYSTYEYMQQSVSEFEYFAKKVKSFSKRYTHDNLLNYLQLFLYLYDNMYGGFVHQSSQKSALLFNMGATWRGDHRDAVDIQNRYENELQGLAHVCGFELSFVRALYEYVKQESKDYVQMTMEQ